MVLLNLRLLDNCPKGDLFPYFYMKIKLGSE